VAGSATACTVQLDQQTGTLVGANLGDSGFMVVRSGEVIVRSRPLQHYFDCPLQFGAFPEFVEATDTADMADLYSLPVQHGDFVVAGSDGLWDNMFDSDIVTVLAGSADQLQVAADHLAMMARQHAADPDYLSPYSKEALQQGFDLPWWEKLLGAGFKNGKFSLKQLTGGKMDDITVLVGRIEMVPEVVEETQAPPESGTSNVDVPL
jgi:protein phosphatase PTC7